jgi:hypothetical protein
MRQGRHVLFSPAHALMHMTTKDRRLPMGGRSHMAILEESVPQKARVL